MTDSIRGACWRASRCGGLLGFLACLLCVPVRAQDHAAARADCERLLNAVLPMAVELLRRHGEFYPYGGAIGHDGAIVSLAGYDTRAMPPAADLVATLKQGFVQGARAGEYIATALVQDVSVVIPDTRLGSDAVAVALDHRDGYSVVVVMPYTLKGAEISWGETYTLEGEGDIFTDGTATPQDS